jgi:hypothetical protein
MPGFPDHNYWPWSQYSARMVKQIHAARVILGMDDVAGEQSMDPITTAIVAVLLALASEMVKFSVKDANEGLKAAD